MNHLLTVTGRAFFQAVDDLGLSFSQIKLVGLLGDAAEPVSLGALSDKLGLSLPAVSRAVDGLVKRGFVKREEDPLDRRSKRVRLTASGRRSWERFTAVRLAGLRDFVEGLEPAEREALAQGLEPIGRREEIAAQVRRYLAR
jgi:DNA-binding MarR family transcriptional regulator